MDERILALLSAVACGTVSVQAAFEELKDVPFQDLTHTKIDLHRQLRKGIQEVIFGEGKTFEQIEEIVRSMTGKGIDVLATRIDPEKGGRLVDVLSRRHLSRGGPLLHHQEGHVHQGERARSWSSPPGRAISPLPRRPARPPRSSATRRKRLYDVGVAGIHRLFQNLDLLKKARVIIVAAGMEGALPSIVAGIVGVPVIAVPTSIGYGASFGGISALLAMLNSCSTVATFNIDNGFGAAYFATLINRL